jgi:acetylornithine deacetylase/succinyl-diaminopimelate desuccinylase-like protein
VLLRTLLALVLGISAIATTRIAAAADQQNMGYFFPRQQDAMGQPTAGSKPATVKFNRASAAQAAAYDKFFKENQQRHLKDVADLVAFPTLRMDPKHHLDIQKAAKFLKAKLDAIGMQNVTIHPPEFPFVTAEWMGAPGQPTVIVYGHFDVQPVVPSQWKSDPFKAEIRDGKMYGRGATDDKGPIIAFISTPEAMMKLDGKLPVNVKLIFDGSEEFGSPTMPDWLAQPKIKAWVTAADYGINLDAMMQSDNQGLLWKSLRGTVAFQVNLKSANTALHSGLFGGVAPDSAVAASKIIASLFNDDGTVAVKGFDNELLPIAPEDKKNIAKLSESLDAAAVAKKYGVAQWIGDKRFSPLERTYLRGSCSVTGLKSGYTEGSGAIIPESAWFNILCRLGPGQDPNKIAKQFAAHIKSHTSWGIQVDVKTLSPSVAVLIPGNDPSYALSKSVQTAFYGQPPAEVYCPGSVPALSYLKVSGAPNFPALGVQRADEGFHADNEFMRISSFEKGQRLYAMMLHALVGQPLREK